MENLIFTMSRRQLTGFLVRYGVIFAVMVSMPFIASLHKPLTGLGMAVGILALSTAAAAGGRTVVSPSGIEVRQFYVRRRHFAWEQIAGLQPLENRGSTFIRLHLVDGRHLALPCPSTTALAPHPGYPAERDQLLAYWHRHAVHPNASIGLDQ
ncbi:PH domain-containing protein [Kitasatospora sp. GP82]|uniref:PH domain-containing protein n=1 Tax=Kitasatospora sp. GP82 TaxID=3035089 RepID=UPI00247728C2|nr:PH domain-containing protein [Kitasatospora sp. GP82]